MQVIATETTNTTLLGSPENNIIDIPCTRIIFNEDINGFETCWELSEEDLATVIQTRRLYLTILGDSHPAVCISVRPTELDPPEGFEVTDVPEVPEGD